MQSATSTATNLMLPCEANLSHLKDAGYTVDSVSSYLYLSEKAMRVSLHGPDRTVLTIYIQPDQFETVLSVLGWKS